MPIVIERHLTVVRQSGRQEQGLLPDVVVAALVAEAPWPSDRVPHSGIATCQTWI
jgi:hypothetical protein